MFCPKCGSILRPKVIGAKTIMACSCGYADKEVGDVKIGEKLDTKSKKVEIVMQEEDETLPVAEIDCGKCGNDKAYFWSVQTRAGDEAETKFFRCTKCKHTWRDYD